MEQTDLDNLEWRRRRLNCVGIIRWFTSSISVRVRWLRWRGTAAMMECYYGSNVMCWYREQSPHPDLCHREDHLNNHYGNKLGSCFHHTQTFYTVLAAWAGCWERPGATVVTPGVWRPGPCVYVDPRLGEGQRQCWCHIPAPHLTTRGPQFGHWGTLYIAS